MKKVHLQVFLVGHKYVGKTSLMNRFMNGSFNENKPCPTILYSFVVKSVEIDDTMTVNMGIWDAGGEIRTEEQVEECYRCADAVIVCYDASEVESFKRVRFWLQELKRLPEKCKIYVCGTKSDLLLINPITPEIRLVKNYAEEMNAKFFLTSSKTGKNVDTLFKVVASDYLQNAENINQMEIQDTVYYGKRPRNSRNYFNCFSWIGFFFKRV